MYLLFFVTIEVYVILTYSSFTVNASAGSGDANGHHSKT
jgi:hypothetical protein